MTPTQGMDHLRSSFPQNKEDQSPTEGAQLMPELPRANRPHQSNKQGAAEDEQDGVEQPHPGLPAEPLGSPNRRQYSLNMFTCADGFNPTSPSVGALRRPLYADRLSASCDIRSMAPSDSGILNCL